jgi:uncharacterized membrane protein
MSNQYPPPSPPPSGYGTPYGSPQMSNPLTPPGATPPGGKTSMGLETNLAALLCYLGNIVVCCTIPILSTVFFFTEKENRFIRFHAMQSILLFGVAFVIRLLIGIVSLVLSIGIGRIALVPGMLVGLAYLVVLVLCAIKAYQGEWYKLPVIGDIAENISK